MAPTEPAGGTKSDTALRKRKKNKSKNTTLLESRDADGALTGTPTATGSPHTTDTEKPCALAHQPPQQRIRRRRWFIAGIVIGFLVALATVLYTNPTSNTHISKIHTIIGDFEISSLVPDTLLPDDFIRDITKLLSSDTTEQRASEDFQPAMSLVEEEGLGKKHNVILVPGIISSGLESWSTGNCSRPYFRQRLWGTSTMFKAILLDKECWVQHMMLDKKTGLDPAGIKLRAAQGLDAADYFITGYWIWGKAIENLAVLGYDCTDMTLAAYDWRLSYSDLERRDQYFSNLQSRIERALRTGGGKKTVMIAHSMGSQVIHYFMKWVESPKGGKGGKRWVNDHIEAVVTLAGTPLGVPKTLSSLLSGEQRETVQPLASYLLEHFMNRNELARIFRSWTGLPSLLPKGGNAIWGDLDGAPDDLPHVAAESTMETSRIVRATTGNDTEDEQFASYGAQLRFDGDGGSGLGNQTMEDALGLLERVLDADALRFMRRDFSYGVSRTQKEMDAHADDPRTWTNPLQHQLPDAPNMTIFCLYGHGAVTERAYYYTADRHDLQQEESGAPPALRIDKRPRSNVANVDIGIVHGQGDGTVPLMSLGYMCGSGWRKPLYNPHGVRIVTREFIHNPLAAFKDIRGGAAAADHINILGNRDATADILRIVSGHGHRITDRFSSDILEYAKRVNIP
ncbi:phospholipid:diacylglycerol acyltransferase [Coemansia sp. RSA 1813]|nr:phospholipid:diacylglycerol acyltransferase [Coemansia sp. RSA 1646]KAJ1766276.1 phospholipid:diacylglycerol acyltransferase [Coemansia sp. RSA 1843]KAJ2085994.1 phospholipid:diacylglycerol acyltransferase [Coemansia sp. RSA 986]KAJ2215015.1 phospholipid:diacylglycerol acyltransferase [Coemansia sp. RSA 487]KAJ2563657.1 phospholipid:diacylglycerol acyltransferase [Coemansia sp. RSA 1813]